MRRWITGNVLLALGLAWSITDRALRTRYPLSWGGPNIGAGGLLLVADGCILAGVVLLAISGAAGWRALRRRTAAALPAAVTIVLVLAWVTALVVLPGDGRGNSGINGAVGLSVDATGAPVLVLEICKGSVNRVSVYAPTSTGGSILADLRSTAPVSTPTSVNLVAPDRGWKGAALTPALMTAVPRTLMVASADGDESELTPVDFSASDLTHLTPATVQVPSDSTIDDTPPPHRMARSAFHDAACHPATG